MKRPIAAATFLLPLLLISRAPAQEPPTDPALDPAHPADVVHDDPRDVRKPTEIGIRFTPAIAAAMSKKIVEEMKPKYELDGEQTEKISRIVQQQLLKFAHENAVVGRDMIEMMMAVSIENEGRFPKEDAERFARLAKPFVPKLRGLFTDCSAEIGRQMSMRQRLQFTADVTLAAAGIGVFESRMNRWEQGKVGERANPFFDPADEPPAAAAPAPQPGQTVEYARAKNNVDKWIQFQVNPDDQWATYLDDAGKYYQFTAPQLISARAILAECRDRAKAIKTPQWQDSLKEMYIISELSVSPGNKVQMAPWLYSLNSAIRKHRKPIIDLEDEFKRRLDELADSQQRALARENIRKILEEKGVKQLPQ